MGTSFLDSIGHYAYANRGIKWASEASLLSGSGSSIALSATGSPSGGPAYLATAMASGTAALALYARGDRNVTRYFGARFKLSRLDSTTYGTPILEVRTGNSAVAIFVTGTGAISARGPTSYIYAPYSPFTYANLETSYNVLYNTSSVQPCTAGSWFYAETMVTLNQTAGVIKVWIDGNLVLDLSGLDTLLDYAEIEFAVMGVRIQGTSQTALMCDYYVGSSQLGEVRIDPHFPDSYGTDRDWSLSTGTNEDDVVDDTDAVAGTGDYLYTSTVGHKTSLNIEALRNTGGTIQAVQLTTYLTKQNAGPCGVKPYVYRSGSDRQYGSEFFPAWGSWKMCRYVWDTDPIASGAWTESNFNATEFGLERTT